MAPLRSAERSLAPVASDDPATQRHYVAQLALLLALRRALAKLWPAIDRRNLKDSIPTYATQVAALVDQYAQANIAISADFYEQARMGAGVKTPFTTPLIDPPLSQDVEDAVRGALDPLWSPVASDTTSPTDAALARLDEIDRLEAERAAQVRAEENAEKLVANAGRNELIEAIEKDRAARGFARVTKAGACSFCTLMAIRGAVYKSAGTAGRDANERFTIGSGTAKFHNNCRCTITPVFSRHYEAPAHIRQAEQDYLDATERIHGSKAKQKAWRRAWEDRVDGPQRPGKSRSGSTREVAPELGFETLTRDQLENQIRLLEVLKDSPYKTKQMARLRKRLTEV